jgi:hypothetical protein
MNMLLRSIIGSFASADKPVAARRGRRIRIFALRIELSRLLQLGKKLPSQEADDTLVKLTHPRLRQPESASYLMERLALLVAQVQDRLVSLAEGAYRARQVRNGRPVLGGARRIGQGVIVDRVPRMVVAVVGAVLQRVF